MSRPNLVRADTIDLQDQEKPSASDHYKQAADLNQSGLAPHQAAELHHVLEERHSEEQSLADVWSQTNESVDDGSGKPAQVNGANADRSNGTNESEDHDDDEEDGEDADVDGVDDMMDRISSSPSIDDGVYIPETQPRLLPALWPARSTSLVGGPTTLQEDFNSPASLLSSIESSPFVLTPPYLPLRKSGGANGEDLPLRLAKEDDYSSSFDELPNFTSPVKSRNVVSPLPFPKHHHWTGRYDKIPDLDTVFEEHDSDLQSNTKLPALGVSMDRPADSAQHTGCVQRFLSYSDESPLARPSRRHSASDWAVHASSSAFDSSGKSPSVQSLDAEELQFLMDRPILDQPPPSPTTTDSSWEDTSDSEFEPDEAGSGTASDDDANIFLDLDNRFIDSGWGGECLRDTEDIDFEFVYALHTFVATVEGQANATKGDTMVLLDDSNSYWWLVRVVKDSSIGYLPAEHIETPTERLARLNKHRNIDLSATMLSDNSEKTRNPLKKAMRRRNAKTVQFAAPTYVEASDYDYSSDEDDQAGLDPYAGTAQPIDGDPIGQDGEKELQSGGTGHADDADDMKPGNRGSFDREQAASSANAADQPQLSPRFGDKTEAAPLKSRKGTPRNTDSFLKDDSIETRKITLTPGILREDASSTKSASSESARNNSMESLEKVISAPEPAPVATKKDLKEVKKKEVKKGGMLSGLFKSKKKDKKGKDDGSEASNEKISMDLSRDSPKASPYTSGTTSPIERTVSSMVAAAAAEGNQQPPIAMQPAPSRPKPQPSNSKETAVSGQVTESEAENKAFVAELPGEEVAVEMAANVEPVNNHSMQAGPEKETKDNALTPLTNMLRPSTSKDPKPTKAKRSKQRVELDDFDSPADDDGPNPFEEQEVRNALEGPTTGTNAPSNRHDEATSDGHGTFMHGTEIIHIPEPGTGEGADDDGDDDKDGPESMSSSPSITEAPAEPASDVEEHDSIEEHSVTPTGPPALQIPATHQAGSLPRLVDTAESTMETSQTPPARRSTPAVVVWSDSNLRAWLEDGSEVKDMLRMIHDKSSIVPVSNDHPMMKGLYDQPRKGVQDLMGQLDGLLDSFIQRRGISLP